MSLGILPRYVMTSALLSMLGAVIGLWLIQMIFAYLSELENLSQTYTFVDALWFIMYRSPYFLVQFMPTGALLGAVIGLGLLAGNSELVVMRAAGVSIYRIIGWTMLPAFLFVVMSLVINQFVLPITNQKAAAVVNRIEVDRPIFVNGYWSVNNQDDGMDITYISYADNTGKLGQTKRYHLDNHANLTHALTAQTGEYQHKYQSKNQDGYTWQLSNVSQITIGGAGVVREHQDSSQLALPIAPTDVHLLTKDADDLSLTDLYTHKQLMKSQKLRSLRHELVFWQKLLSPFALLSLVLVASSFVFGSMRSQSLGLRIVMALLTGLIFSYLTDLLGFVALATNSSPLLMAFLPIVISTVAGIYLLEKRQ